ncbi:MAG: RelE protein [Parcubacteria group bacterium Gr01-1014_3]|nr:MAG: RelE protein [Parcubacteria group bacterium Gr01-1014_3]
MSRYHVIIAKSARKRLQKLPRAKKDGVLKALKDLEQDPFLGQPLTGELAGKFSIHIWPYRIIYRIEKNRLIILVLSIGHRQSVYKH